MTFLVHYFKYNNKLTFSVGVEWISYSPDIKISRSHRKGGGTAVIDNSNLKFRFNNPPHFKTFELLDANVHATSKVIRLALVYKPRSGTLSFRLIWNR